ncbi:MAG: DUF4397 domain-containing protein [Anaerolineae bacterium]|nr:DUF4397 domain-containing protein [Anaerolineae bacterium]
MKHHALVLLILVFLAVLAIPAVAQETPTPEAPVTEATDADADMTEATETPVALSPDSVVHLRIANLASDGDALVPYVNGEPSAIQTLAPGTISGWAEVPAGASVSFVPDGSEQTVAGPVTVNTTGSQWTTIAITGSAADDTLTAYTVKEQLTALPFGCAQVTVVNTIADGADVDLVYGGVGTLDTNFGLSGSSASPDVQLYNTCAAGDAIPSYQEGGPVACAEVGSSSGRFANCGVTVLVPAETTSLQGITSETNESRFSLDDIQPNNFYFVVIAGTADNPQTYVQAVSGDQLNNMAGFYPAGAMEDMSATESATPEMDMEATVEPTVESAVEPTLEPTAAG